LNRVKELRKSKNISQKNLAQMVGISATHLNRVENDSNKLPFPLASRIAEVLGCSMEEIFLHQKFTISKQKENEDGKA